MATIKLTDAAVKSLPAPAHGNKIHYDSELAGFGVRVTEAGAKSYIFNYRTKWQPDERRYHNRPGRGRIIGPPGLEDIGRP